MENHETHFLMFWRLVAERTDTQSLPRVPGPDLRRCFDADMGITETVEAWKLQVEHEAYIEVAA